MKSSDRKSSRSSGQGPVGTCVSMFCPHKQPKKKNKPHPVMHSSKAATLATVANNAVVACCCRSLFASSASCSHLMLPDRHSSRLQSAYNNSSSRERGKGAPQHEPLWPSCNCLLPSVITLCSRPRPRPAHATSCRITQRDY